MPSRILLREWKAGNFITRLSGLILPPSTLDDGVASWIASLAAIRANPTRSPESGRGKLMTASCSTRSFASSRKAGLVVSSAKTCRGTLTDSSGYSSRHWKDWATALRQEFSVRPKWGPAIAESDCSSWPTVRTSDVNGPGLHGDGGMDLRTVAAEWQSPTVGMTQGGSKTRSGARSGEMLLPGQAEVWMTPRVAMGGYTRDRGDPEAERQTLEGQASSWPTPMAGTPAQNGNNAAGSSDFSLKAMELAEAMRVWATPRAEDSESAGMRHGRGVADTLTAQCSIWPTPAARDFKGSPEELTRPDGKSRLDQLDRVAERGFPFSLPAPPIPAGATSSPPSRRLNPRFVEWLMGWPIGWTDCESAETGLSRWLLHSRGVLSTLVSPPPSAVDQGSLF
jgi:hypothetical protein